MKKKSKYSGKTYYVYRNSIQFLFPPSNKSAYPSHHQGIINPPNFNTVSEEKSSKKEGERMPTQHNTKIDSQPPPKFKETIYIKENLPDEKYSVESEDNVDVSNVKQNVHPLNDDNNIQFNSKEISLLKNLLKEIVKDRATPPEIPIVDMIKKNFKGANITIHTTDGKTHSGEVVYDFENMIALKAAGGIITFIYGDKIVAFF
ncbi:MAG: hypothetical protein N4A62_16065 [Marinisporobacter sp.]|nr:hypothetical protein [Marinisporobacter sp.]